MESGRTQAAARRASVALLSGFVLLACGPADEASAPPLDDTQARNVLLYIVDTLRADALGAYGNQVVDTPAADRLAREGLVFEDAHAHSSWTRPSVASILTGRYPPDHGAETRRDRLAAGVESLASVLGAEGFSTAFITTNPNVGTFFGFDRGFDDMIELYERREAGRVRTRELITTSDEVTREAAAWLEDARQPFFLVVHTIDPHTPYTPPASFDRYAGDYRGPVDGTRKWINEALLSEADRDRIRSLYLGEVASNDHALGELLDTMESLGRLDDTLIVFTSDHGEELWENGVRGHGRSLRDTATRVPLIVRLPQGTRRARIARPVEGVDIMPTVLDWLGLPIPPTLVGSSLLATHDRERIQVSRLTLGRVRMEAARQAPWKLVRDLDSGDEVLFEVGAGERAVPAEAQPAVRRRLAQALDEMANSEGASADAASLEDLPEEMRAALEELGYLEPDEDPARHDGEGSEDPSDGDRPHGTGARDPLGGGAASP